MNKLKVLIVDDELDAIEVLSNILLDTGMVEIVGVISDALKVESAVNRLSPDLLFLDIEMPKITGVDLLKRLRNYNHSLKVVMVIAYNQYVTDVIGYNVYSYLLKPVDRLELISIVKRLIAEKEQQYANNDKIKLQIRDGYIFIRPQDVFMLKAEGNYTTVYLCNKTVYVSSYNMGRLVERFPFNTFLRINRACMLNADYLHSVSKTKGICLAYAKEMEMELPVSNSFLSEFNRRYK